MAVTILFSAVVGLLTKGVPAAVTTLKVRYKQIKATKDETLELEKFLHDLQDCATQCEIGYGGKLNAKIITSTVSSFAKELEDAQKTLDQWSSQKDGFFSRSPGERLRKLQALRKKVDRAMKIEALKLAAATLGIVTNCPPNSQTTTVVKKTTTKTTTKEVVKQSCTVVTTEETVVKSGTPPTVVKPSKPVKAPSTAKNNEKSIKPTAAVKKRSQSATTKRPVEKDRIEKLWVRLDSEKQAKDMDTKLKEIPDVKSVKYNVGTHEVWVELGAGSKVRSATLCNTIQRGCALPKGKLPPTRWADRKCD